MYFLKRLAFLVPLLLVISMIAFALVRVAPGGPFDKERKPASPEIERNLKAKYHLDERLWKQYLRFLGIGYAFYDEDVVFNKHDELVVTKRYFLKGRDGKFIFVLFDGGIIRGDFGPSLKYRNHGVTDIIAQGLPVSITLGLSAFALALGLGIPVGFYAAVRKGGFGDYAGSFVAILAVCIPALVVGPLLVMGLAIRWRIFPVGLWETPWHVVLPTVTLGLYFAGRVARLMREGMLGTLHDQFIVTARAKGLDDTTVLLKHALRIAILPVVSYSGPLLADLLTGSFVVENLFRIPGIGVFMVNSSLNRDYPMVVGLVLLYAVLLLVLNLLVDVAYSYLDRRVKYE